MSKSQFPVAYQQGKPAPMTPPNVDDPETEPNPIDPTENDPSPPPIMPTMTEKAAISEMKNEGGSNQKMQTGQHSMPQTPPTTEDEEVDLEETETDPDPSEEEMEQMEDDAQREQESEEMRKAGL
jgi:hypothetical protein